MAIDSSEAVENTTVDADCIPDLVTIGRDDMVENFQRPFEFFCGESSYYVVWHPAGPQDIPQHVRDSDLAELLSFLEKRNSEPARGLEVHEARKKTIANMRAVLWRRKNSPVDPPMALSMAFGYEAMGPEEENDKVFAEGYCIDLRRYYFCHPLVVEEIPDAMPVAEVEALMMGIAERGIPFIAKKENDPRLLQFVMARSRTFGALKEWVQERDGSTASISV